MTHPSVPPKGWAAALSAELAAATLFLTRLPVTRRTVWPGGLIARSFSAFPLIGAGIGAAAAAVYWAAAAAGLGPLPAAILALAFQVWLTRGLHEDGLADFTDGLGGGTEPDERLAIMRDSRLGAFGASALILVLGLRAATVADLAAPQAAALALVVAGALSRAGMVALTVVLAPATARGLAAYVGRPTRGRIVVAVGFALVIAGLLLPRGAALAAVCATVLAVAVAGRVARRRLGGYTGDVLGAAQQLGEVAVLIALAAAL